LYSKSPRRKRAKADGKECMFPGSHERAEAFSP
jgi:hypothetical protein